MNDASDGFSIEAECRQDRRDRVDELADQVDELTERVERLEREVNKNAQFCVDVEETLEDLEDYAKRLRGYIGRVQT